MMRVAPVVGLVALVLIEPTADAGCICPDLTTVRTGDLVVTNATITKQRWSVNASDAELELELSGASAKTTIDLLVFGIAKAEHADFVSLAKANKRDTDPSTLFMIGKDRVTGTVLRKEAGDVHESRMRWTLPATTNGNVTIKIDWTFPAAGADAKVDTSARAKEFCFTSKVRKTLRKADGFLRADFVVSKDMATGFELAVVQNGPWPSSTCAKGKVVNDTFAIVGRENLQDRAGVLPILFGASI